jgi:membrane protein
MAISTSDRSSKPRDRRGDASQPGRGRQAEEPSQVPVRGWRDILIRTKNEISSDNISIVAAGVAFYCFLAFVPALTALLGIYALVADPAQASQQIEQFASVLPHEILPLLKSQIERLVSANQAAGVSAAIGIVLALYGSTSATKALIQGINIAYDEEEKRGFIRLQLVALALTAAAIVGAIIAIALVAVAPALLNHLHVSGGVETAVKWARWPVLLAGYMAGLAILYRYGPSRNDAKWSWVSWGAAAATVLWLLGSAAFSLYVAKIGNYDKTYGSLGALVVFLMWLYLSAFVVLVGAELNSEMERQTERDTTRGGEKPLGQRAAHSADTVGPAQD